jgi:hydroxyethylthiazole kinase-like uncharacterized protein yjeF
MPVFASDLALPDPEEKGQIDRFTARTVPIATLMENAGRAVARAVKIFASPCRVLVLCGPGNNGGDGYVAARYLSEQGWPVSVAVLVEPSPGGDAALMVERLNVPRVPFSVEEAARADLVIDAVFGAGLNRDVVGKVADVLAAARRLVAIDVPTGLDGHTGQVRGFAPQAELTVTFFRPSPGHLLFPGRSLCGHLVVRDIGIKGEDAFEAVPVKTWLNWPGLWRLPILGPQSHKYTRGVVSLCAGESMPGAARLAAAGARSAGAGLVRISAEANAPALRLAVAPGLIVDGQPLEQLLTDVRRRVWICGPGLTVEEAAHALPILLSAGRQVVADAGALGLAAGVPEKLKGVSVITPHEGEFVALFGAVGEDAVAAVRVAAVMIDAVVVLKGATTVIAAPDGRVALNTHASVSLGTAGSGDTLSGVIAALLAAGMPVWEAAAAGVWLHGEAGLRAGGWCLAEDLDRYLGDARGYATALQDENASRTLEWWPGCEMKFGRWLAEGRSLR